MAWKRYFTPVQQGSTGPLTNSNRANPTRSNYSSYLPDVYSGHPNRLERYSQYDTMDLDPEVNAAFDILAERFELDLAMIRLHFGKYQMGLVQMALVQI